MAEADPFADPPLHWGCPVSAAKRTEQIAFAATVVVAACAWIAFAERPTARNLRTALLRTLGLA